jgi:hypothetical protein
MSYTNSHSCPRKYQARLDTIINVYKSLFHNSIPTHQQYYTLSGPITSDNKSIGKYSELQQLLSSNLITQNQYHGIDYNLDIINQNKLAAPNANFHHGDFFNTLKHLSNTLPNFNPAIIHADFINCIKKTQNTIANILYLLNKSNSNNTLLTINLPYNNPYKSSKNITPNPHTIWNTLSNNQRFADAFLNNWQLIPHYYQYNGTGDNSNTIMISFNLFKKE